MSDKTKPAKSIEFDCLNSIVSLFTPSPHIPAVTTTPSVEKPPVIIIICQWMGASPRSRSLASIHQKNHSLDPSARIITVRSIPSFYTTTSTSARQQLMNPIIAAITSTDLKPRILVHLFSNGGALTLTDICTVFRRQTGTTLALQSIILDSAPGNPGIAEGWASMESGIPRGILWYPTATILSVLLLSSWVRRHVVRAGNMFEQMGRDLNDGDLVDQRARRLYVYSKEDRIVGWKDVEAHAKEARAAGLDVEIVEVKGSIHVQHMGKEGAEEWEKYWSWVRNQDGSGLPILKSHL